MDEGIRGECTTQAVSKGLPMTSNSSTISANGVGAFCDWLRYQQVAHIAQSAEHILGKDALIEIARRSTPGRFFYKRLCSKWLRRKCNAEGV